MLEIKVNKGSAEAITEGTGKVLIEELGVAVRAVYQAMLGQLGKDDPNIEKFLATRIMESVRLGLEAKLTSKGDADGDKRVDETTSKNLN